LVAAPESRCGGVGIVDKPEKAGTVPEALASLRGTAPSTPLRAGEAAVST